MSNDEKRRRVEKLAKNGKQEQSERRKEKQKKDILKALKNTMGNVSLSCEKVGISRFAFYKWRDEDPEFDKAVEEINERTLDFVESKLMQGIQDGNARMIIFFLSTKGRGRGYGQTKENGEKSSGVILNITSDEAEY